MTARGPLDVALVAEFRRRVLEARARLLRTLATTDEELATLEGHQPGGPLEDTAREQALAILGRLGDQEKHTLEEIHAASARLDAGVFGLCQGCGGTIPLERLRAVPTTRRCLACQTRQERHGPR